jgi:hypothetical protein
LRVELNKLNSGVPPLPLLAQVVLKLIHDVDADGNDVIAE